jgi:hypothetical protein
MRFSILVVRLNVALKTVQMAIRTIEKAMVEEDEVLCTLKVVTITHSISELLTMQIGTK